MGWGDFSTLSASWRSKWASHPRVRRCRSGLALRQTSSVPPKDGVHLHAAPLALRMAATNPELVGSFAALL
jgi:hypothetical protein